MHRRQFLLSPWIRSQAGTEVSIEVIEVFGTTGARALLGHHTNPATRDKFIRWLHEVNYRLKVPRPWPDRQDERLRAAFQTRLKEWLADADIDLWYLDECGVEGDPRPRRR